MPLSDFKVVESVGKGSFASVYKVLRKSDKQLYALKRVKIGKMSKREIQDALNEIRFLASIRHRNVVGFLEAFHFSLYYRIGDLPILGVVMNQFLEGATEEHCLLEGCEYYHASHDQIIGASGSNSSNTTSYIV